MGMIGPHLREKMLWDFTEDERNRFKIILKRKGLDTSWVKRPKGMKRKYSHPIDLQEDYNDDTIQEEDIW